MLYKLNLLRVQSDWWLLLIDLKVKIDVKMLDRKNVVVEQKKVQYFVP